MKIIKSNLGQDKNILYLREKEGIQYFESMGSSGIQALGYGARDVNKVSYKDVKDGDLLYAIYPYRDPAQSCLVRDESLFEYRNTDFSIITPMYINTWVSSEYADYNGSSYIPVVCVSESSMHNHLPNVERSLSPTAEFPVVDLIDRTFINSHIINFAVKSEQDSSITIQSILLPDGEESDYAVGIDNLHAITYDDFSEYKDKVTKNYGALTILLYSEKDDIKNNYCLSNMTIQYSKNSNKVYIGSIVDVITPGVKTGNYLISILMFNHPDYSMFNTFSYKGFNFSLSHCLIGGNTSLIHPEYFEDRQGPSTNINYGSYGVLPFQNTSLRLDEVLPAAFLRNIGECYTPSQFYYEWKVILKIPYMYVDLTSSSGSYNIPNDILSTIYNQKQFVFEGGTLEGDYNFKVPVDWLYKNFKIKKFNSEHISSGDYVATIIEESTDFIYMGITWFKNTGGDYGYGYGGEYPASEQYIGEFEE